MTPRLPDPETAPEVALVASLASILGGVGVLLFGRATGGARRHRRRHEAPPAPDSVPDERHQHIARRAYGGLDSPERPR